MSFVGRLVNDVKLKYTSKGHAIASFNIAVQQSFKNDEGEYKVDFFPVEVWRNTAENLSVYCKKGNKIAVEGKLRSRNYKDKGENLTFIFILAKNISYLDYPNSKIKEN